MTSAFYELADTDAELQIVEKYRSEIDGIDDYDKKKMNGKYQVGSGRVVAITHDTPFISNSIRDSAEKNNSFSEKSSEKISDGGKSSLADREALTSVFYELAETDAELQIVEKYRSEIMRKNL